MHGSSRRGSKVYSALTIKSRPTSLVSGFPQPSPAGDALICGFVSKYLMGTVHEQWTGSMQPVYFVNGFYILSRRHCYISP